MLLDLCVSFCCWYVDVCLVDWWLVCCVCVGCNVVYIWCLVGLDWWFVLKMVWCWCCLWLVDVCVWLGLGWISLLVGLVVLLCLVVFVYVWSVICFGFDFCVGLWFYSLSYFVGLRLVNRYCVVVCCYFVFWWWYVCCLKILVVLSCWDVESESVWCVVKVGFFWLVVVGLCV